MPDPHGVDEDQDEDILTVLSSALASFSCASTTKSKHDENESNADPDTEKVSIGKVKMPKLPLNEQAADLRRAAVATRLTISFKEQKPKSTGTPVTVSAKRLVPTSTGRHVARPWRWPA
jgi:hypothetical protein